MTVIKGRWLLISYNSELLQEICFQASVATRHLGEKAAISLQTRHSDIEAADNVFDLPVGQVSVNDNLCTLTVANTLSIVMAPNYGPSTEGALYDWATVGRIKLMAINDAR